MEGKHVLMSQQQSEFQYADQAGSESAGQAINSDPHEQTGQAETPELPPDYVGAQPMGGQKIYPQQMPRRRRRRGWGILVIAVIVLVVLFGTGYISNSAFGRSAQLPEKSLAVTGTPTVVVHDATGTVHFHSGDSNRVVVDATAHGGLFSNLSTDNVRVTEDASGSTILISVSEDGSIFNHGNIDLDIALPSTSNIQTTLNAGTLDINGISGQMDVQVNAGTLNFENGKIEGHSTFVDNAGTINFDGALADNGDYHFTNNAGTINVTLPADSSFTLDASADVGKVHNDFHTNTVGPNPTSQLHVTDNLGTVNIHKK